MQFIGHVSVDSGQVALLDPCYIHTKEQRNETGYETLKDEDIWDPSYYATTEASYGAACEASLNDAGGGQFMNGSAVCVRTAYGDGVYPVYRDGDKVVIDFNPSV